MGNAMVDAMVWWGVGLSSLIALAWLAWHFFRPRRNDSEGGDAEALDPPRDVKGRFERAFKEADRRQRAFGKLVGRQESTDFKGAACELSATDLFVEKAHVHLEERARNNNFCALLTGFGAAALIVAIACSIQQSFLHFDYGQIANPSRDLYHFVFEIVKAIAFDGVLLGLVYFLGSLCRAFLHEATLMENRLHAARLGRLYIYLKFAGLKEAWELDRARGELEPDKLGQIFGWNIETSTAFKDINAKNIAMGLVGQASTLLGQVIEARKATESSPKNKY